MPRKHLLALLLTGSLSLNHSAQAQQITLPQLPIDSLNLSGIVEFDDKIALVSDEGSALVILGYDKQWQLIETIELDKPDIELDLEALTYIEPYLYAIGSHSVKRKKLKADKTQKKNLKRLAETSAETPRKQLFRIELKNGHSKQIDKVTLTEFIEEQSIIAPFLAIPSKENGVDIEAISHDSQGRLLIGFRGPVLRGNMVPVLSLKTKGKKNFKVKDPEWLWLDLDGRGIRGMTPAKGGQLILAGPVGDQEMSFALYYWDGSDQITGSDRPKKGLRQLCKLENVQGKPEGIQFQDVKNNKVEFWLIEDGLNGGNLRTMQCAFK